MSSFQWPVFTGRFGEKTAQSRSDPDGDCFAFSEPHLQPSRSPEANLPHGNVTPGYEQSRVPRTKYEKDRQVQPQGIGPDIDAPSVSGPPAQGYGSKAPDLSVKAPRQPVGLGEPSPPPENRDQVDDKTPPCDEVNRHKV